MNVNGAAYKPQFCPAELICQSIVSLIINSPLCHRGEMAATEELLRHVRGMHGALADAELARRARERMQN